MTACLKVVAIVALVCAWNSSPHTSLNGQVRQPVSAVDMVKQMVQVETTAYTHRQHFLYREDVRAPRTKGHLWSELVIETAEGRLRRLLAEDGTPLSPERTETEDKRINYLVSHPDEFRKETRARREDEGRMTTILQDLPRMFLFRTDGSKGECARIVFEPNPAFQEQSYQDRVVHAMSGVLLIHAPDMRLCGMDAHLDYKVEFGFGLLGEVSDGSNFSLTREEVCPGQWRTTKLHIHVDGSMLLLKSYSRNEQSKRYDFKPVAKNLTVAQAASIAPPNVLPQEGSNISPAAQPDTVTSPRLPSSLSDMQRPACP